MQPQMLHLLIRVLSERLHLWVCIVGQPYYTSTNRRHRGRSTTPRNQQHENFVINDSLSLSGSELREMVGTTNIHLVRTLDTHITIEVAIYDTMQFVQPDVHTICMGLATSMGSFLLAGGEITKRLAFPHARRQ
ncbi:hypothetical protein ERO13_A09G045346v2 [Gossypium hirsutum]|nr:hypothetical protein ERO13_A09G045346v2 [Gossypium hirsutum]